MRANLLLSFIFFGNILFAQGDFYDLDKVQNIEIEFEENDWAAILDGYYVEGDKERLLGNVIINGERIDSVGIRYKGFSSVSVDRKKNPFNIKLDYVKNKSYKGINKIKLGNVIHDPTFVREALSYEIARNYMPASEANFARVSVNGEYLGLYSNVEAVNKDFLSKHFNSSANAFFKAAPEDLDFTGENSNLSNSPGQDTTAYFPYYDKESEWGWIELVDFIQVLNDNPAVLERELNIDRALWMHAFNYAVVNLDSYIGFAQNYYLYQDDLGQFNTLPWDLNMSFGSFSITDASDNFDGVSLNAAKRLDPLAHFNSVSVQPRPLMRKLFENDRYRRMYLAHLRTIMEEHFSDDQFLERIFEIQEVIRTAVEDDENKFYELSGFDSNVNSTYSDLIDYPGLTDLMMSRYDYLKNYLGESQISIMTEDLPADAVEGSEVVIAVVITEASSATLFYRESEEQEWQQQLMVGVGLNMWEATLAMPPDGFEYYIYAENDEQGRFAPARAAYEFYKVRPTVENTLPFNQIVINELMATQDATQADEEGEYDDWIELHNTTNSDIELLGLFLSDKDDQFDKWDFPDTLIRANNYVIVWADEDGSQGPMHANFKLSGGGEYIFLGYADGTVMDSVSFGEQEKDITYGRLPNGTGPFGRLVPTFQASNETSSTSEVEDKNNKLYPNPTGDELNIESSSAAQTELVLYDYLGQQLLQSTFRSKTKVTLSIYESGIYFVTLSEAGQLSIFRIIKQ